MPVYVDSDSTFEELKAEYKNTSSYDVAGDVDLCKRFIVACRLLLVDLQSRAKHGGAEVEMDPSLIADQLDEAKSWLAGNDATATTTANVGGARVFGAENWR